MKSRTRTRKPDIMTLLVFVIGLGVLATGLAQDYLRNAQTMETAQSSPTSPILKN